MTAERAPRQTSTSDHARPGDPFLDLLARMVRTAQERERTERRATLVVMDGGKPR